MMRDWHDSWMYGPGSYFHGPFGMLINLAFWIGLILLVVWAFRAFTARDNPSAKESTALEILKNRYAAGEIDDEEFERMKQELRKD